MRDGAGAYLALGCALAPQNSGIFLHARVPYLRPKQPAGAHQYPAPMQRTRRRHAPVPLPYAFRAADMRPGNSPTLRPSASTSRGLKPLERLNADADKPAHTESHNTQPAPDIAQPGLVCFVKAGKTCDLDLTNTPSTARHRGAPKQPDIWLEKARARGEDFGGPIRLS